MQYCCHHINVIQIYSRIFECRDCGNIFQCDHNSLSQHIIIIDDNDVDCKLCHQRLMGLSRKSIESFKRKACIQGLCGIVGVIKRTLLEVESTRFDGVRERISSIHITNHIISPM